MGALSLSIERSSRLNFPTQWKNIYIYTGPRTPKGHSFSIFWMNRGLWTLYSEGKKKKICEQSLIRGKVIEQITWGFILKLKHNTRPRVAPDQCGAQCVGMPTEPRLNHLNVNNDCPCMKNIHHTETKRRLNKPRKKWPILGELT